MFFQLHAKLFMGAGTVTEVVDRREFISQAAGFAGQFFPDNVGFSQTIFFGGARV